MEKLSKLFMGTGAGITAAALLLGGFFYTVDAGERVLIYDRFRGLLQQPRGEGMHFYIPFIQTPNYFQLRLQPKTISSQTGTRDLQTIDIAIRILHRPIEQFLQSIYVNIGEHYEDKILPSIGNEVLKSIVAQYDADQLLKQREQVSEKIKQQMIERAAGFNITLEDVSLIHLGFMKEYASAIEHKQVAQQQAERQRFIVMRDEEEKKAQIIKAEGESEEAKLINDAVQQYGGAYIEIKRLQAAKSIAEQLSRSSNITFIPTSTGNHGGNSLLINTNK